MVRKTYIHNNLTNMNRKTILLSLLAVAASAAAQTVDKTFYVDFGEPGNDARGHQTTGADANGHYWTNVVSSGNNYLYPGVSFPLIASDNTATSAAILVNTRFMSNGMAGGGGLTAPSAALLGDLAIATATQDYLFMEGFQDYNFITFTGLDPACGYRFHTFGSRVAEAERTATFLFEGENSWSGQQQMAGKGIGDGGYNGNNNKILESDIVFPDREGRIRCTIIKKNKSGMVHLNAMKIEQLSGIERPNQNLSLKRSMYVDFGETDNATRGHQTVGADKNGNYWNNFSSGKSSSNRIKAGTSVSIVDAANAPTGITAQTLQLMETNGVNAGGVLNPTDENLGDLAVQTATEDYVWVNDDNKRQVRFSGLDKNHCYKFYIFGSRITAETTDRNSIYTLEGQDTWSTQLTTSGRCIGGRGTDGKDIQGNVRNVAISAYVFPDRDGNILFTVKRERGMAHFNCMKIEEYEGAVRPDESIELSALTIGGTAVEQGADTGMREVTPNAGTHTGVFETYMRLGKGTLTFSGTTTGGESLTLGVDGSGSVCPGGQPVDVAEPTVARVRVDMKKCTVEVLPVTLYVKGNITDGNTTVAYDGNGVWRQQVEMNSGDVFLFSDKYFYFAFNNDDALAVKRLTGSRTAVGTPADGYSTENIRLNRGTYTLTLDMRTLTFGIDSTVDDNRISVFGSSVANGQGATDFKGYAYRYGQQLTSRYESGASTHPFYTSGISIGGNTTNNLLARYDELTHDFGRYVIFGLSLGNEGVHEAGDKQAVANQWRDNMLRLISMARADGKVPVVMNNYTRGDYTEADYAAVKQLNLLIHQWDVPSINMLGAIDNGLGRWADGYQQDNAHPTTYGHQEFVYAMPPSLFDAIADGKPLPERDLTASMTLGGARVINVKGEGTVHPFTVMLRFKGSAAGKLFSFRLTSNASKWGNVAIDANGHVIYTAPSGVTTDCGSVAAGDDWHYITFTCYYAQKLTRLYLDDSMLLEQKVRMPLDNVQVGDAAEGVSREVSELFFWRSALNADEIKAVCEGKMLKSSLEIYSPLYDSLTDDIPNLAQSLNKAEFVQSPTAIGSVTADESHGSVCYDTAGRRAGSQAKGVVITVDKVSGAKAKARKVLRR